MSKRKRMAELIKEHEDLSEKFQLVSEAFLAALNVAIHTMDVNDDEQNVETLELLKRIRDNIFLEED